LKNNFQYCIFCFGSLDGAERKGRGEHIVPAYLQGSVTIKDVCRKCNNHFGKTADSRIIEDPRVISAIFELDLPELQAKIRDRGSGRIVDRFNGTEAPIRFKNGNPKIQPGWSPEGVFNANEDDWTTHVQRLMEGSRDAQNGGQLHELIENDLKPAYDSLEPGDTMDVSGSDLSIRKGSGQIFQDWKVTDGAAWPFVAKVAYEFAFMCFEKDRILALTDLEHLRDVAFDRAVAKRPVFNYPVMRNSSYSGSSTKPMYHHEIVVSIQDIGVFIDVYLFGSVGFRVYFALRDQIATAPIRIGEQEFHTVSFVMTFEPAQQRQKFCFGYNRKIRELLRWELTSLV